MATTSATTTLLHPADIQSVRGLELRARFIVEGMIAGLHKSPFHGFSAEFLEYRPYRSGESVRTIDWRAYARSGRAYVRLYEDETNCPATIALDKSASMDFRRGAAVTKFEYSRTLAAALAWLLHGQRDAVGLAAFDERVTLLLPARATSIHLTTILRGLEQLACSGRTACAASLSAVASHLRKRGLCIIISDLLDDPDTIATALRHIRFKKQDVIVLHVLDPFECGFTTADTLDITDRETGQRLLVRGDVAAQYQREGMAAHCHALEHACRGLQISYERITTDMPFARALLSVIEKRKHLP